MSVDERDYAYLWDMRDAAEKAIDIVERQSAEAFALDEIRKLALERALEIIGEAAKRISDGTRESTPAIPWRQIIGQRNIIAHEYGRIDHAQLYWTAIEDLPPLVEQLDAMLSESGQSD